MTRYFAVDFLDNDGKVDHNMVGTVEDVFAEAQGRPFVVQREVSLIEFRDYLREDWEVSNKDR